MPPPLQVDNHNPNLTVRETLDFAHSCQMGLHGAPYDVPAELAAARRLETQQHVPHQQGRTGAGAGGGGGGPVAEGHGENAEGQDAAADAAAAAAVAPSGGSHNAQGQGQGKGHGSTAGSFVKSVLSARLHHNHEQHLLEVRARERERKGERRSGEGQCRTMPYLADASGDMESSRWTLTWVEKMTALAVCLSETYPCTHLSKEELKALTCQAS